MSYYDYLDEQFGTNGGGLTEEFLKSKAITVGTKMCNYHDVVVKRVTDEAILFELKRDDETFMAWASKALMKIVNGDNGRLYLIMPNWFKFKAIK